MLKIKQYVKAESLEQAYELNQKKTNRIVGGMLWLKMSTAQIQTAIDLSGLGLDQIEETEDAWKIGCMVSLRDLELHEGLNELSCNMIRESVRSIVGVQFRNLATIGGSIFGRFGFSDVLTCFLALDTEVELYKGGIISLEEFAKMERDNDILVRVIVKKTPGKGSYQSHRNTKTDFPVLAVAADRYGDELKVAVGARPMKAVCIHVPAEQLDACTDLKKFAKERNATLVTGIFNGEHGEYNALTAILADDQVPQPYYKRELVPMGEYIPLSDVLSVFVPANFGNLVAGTEPTTLDTSFGTAGGLICYESIYPYVAREDVEAGAEYFLMVSNDSWFDGSAALRQHLCHAVMRCVENGRDMARAGNTGISAVISAAGTIEKKSNADAEEVLVSDIVPTTERTLYSYIGDLIALPLAGLYAFGIFLMIRGFILKIIAKKREKETISHNV